MICFCRISLQVMKADSFMIIFNVKGSGLTWINLCSLSQKWSFMEEKLICMYAGITVILFILSV